MNEKTTRTLLTIAARGCSVGGLILILAQILSGAKDNEMLFIAIASIILSNIFDLINAGFGKNRDGRG